MWEINSGTTFYKCKCNSSAHVFSYKRYLNNMLLKSDTPEYFLCKEENKRNCAVLLECIEIQYNKPVINITFVKLVLICRHGSGIALGMLVGQAAC